MMRSLIALAVVASALGLAQAARASCAPPEPLAQRVARADAIVVGQVVGFEGVVADRRAAMVRVDRVYKGTVPARVFVRLGPEIAGGGGATSIDYAAEPSTSHTFYLKRDAPGGFSTDACAGTHPGDLDADERASLGAGTAPDPAPGGQGSVSGAGRLIALAVVLGTVCATFAASRAILARA